MAMPKGVWTVGNKMYARCSDCGSIVCLNKWLFGSLHQCLTDAEKLVKQRAEAMQRQQQAATQQMRQLQRLIS